MFILESRNSYGMLHIATKSWPITVCFIVLLLYKSSLFPLFNIIDLLILLKVDTALLKTLDIIFSSFL